MLHTEISINLNEINQPVDISFPQGCLDASKVTPHSLTRFLICLPDLKSCVSTL